MKFASGFFEGTLMRRFLICVLLATISWSPTFSTDWLGFRGPNGSGVSDTTGLPVEFGPDKSLLWKAALPPGHSSPILAGNHIFLTACEKDKLLTLCLDRNIGKILWRREITRARSAGLHSLNSLPRTFSGYGWPEGVRFLSGFWTDVLFRRGERANAGGEFPLGISPGECHASLLGSQYSFGSHDEFAF